MFSVDNDFDIDEDFLKDVFKTAEDHTGPKRASPSPSPHEAVTKKLRAGGTALPLTSALSPHVTVVAPPSHQAKAPGSATKGRASECVSRQRKFPGPAGLLPDRGSGFNRTLEARSDSDDDSETPLQGLCSQLAEGVFQSEAWVRAGRDLSLGGDEGTALAACTLRWARGKALAGQLPGLRVPLLRVALRAIDCSLQDPFVLFHDSTGQMPGTLHREVREAHEARLHPGTVLVLHQVGVLTMRRTLRNHCLNVTANNLVAIYQTPDPQRPDAVEVVRLRDVSLLEAARAVRAINERRLAPDLPGTRLSDCGDQQLFSTVGPRPGLTYLGGALSPSTRLCNGTSSVPRDCTSVNPSPRSFRTPLRNTTSSVPRTVPGGSASTTPSPRSSSVSVLAAYSAQSTLNGSMHGVPRPGSERLSSNTASAKGFTPKTSQLTGPGTPCLNNARCSWAVAESDDERRIAESVLDCIDPSQLFDEDF
ncbi:uncharacterized protein LOC134538793 isoform X2 [Bacillus rossius redtenbacheri]|uniref:uncharacterized protein LOC134538793 isoform X2 n=1 Tax=Bacillus rossius redtenbacheri TaxID=93214 RepID=UPI002FDCE6CD